MVAEGDILGDRLVRPKRKAKRPQDVILEVQALAPGDLVVHADHGIGRFIGLKTVTAAGAPHDCLEIQYSGGLLLLPVENIELLTRYGSRMPTSPSTSSAAGPGRLARPSSSAGSWRWPAPSSRSRPSAS